MVGYYVLGLVPDGMFLFRSSVGLLVVFFSSGFQCYFCNELSSDITVVLTSHKNIYRVKQITTCQKLGPILLNLGSFTLFHSTLDPTDNIWHIMS